MCGEFVYISAICLLLLSFFTFQVLRVDKLPELVESFVSDHIGYKFVEPVQFDLGRIFSETDPSQPLLYTVKGPNEAASDIKKIC